MNTPRKIAQQKPPTGLAFIEDYINEAGEVEVPGIATRLGISPSTFKKWRMRGEGPRTFRMGKRVVARITVIDEWLANLGEPVAA